MGLASFCLAAEYSFQWDANHPNDNVVAYRIYWSKSSGQYNNSDREHIPVGRFSDPSYPRWAISIINFSIGEDYYFFSMDIVSWDSDVIFDSEIYYDLT